MKTRKELKRAETKWISNLIPVDYLQSKQLDIGQKTTFSVEEETDVLITEEDRHYFPTQSDLEKYNFFVKREVVQKIFLPLFEKRIIKKDNVIGKELKITIID